MRRPSTSEVLSSVAVVLVLAFFGIALSSALPCEGFVGTALASTEVNVSRLTVSAIPNQGYTGKALTPAPVVKLGSETLKSGTDYTVEYANNIKKGTATVTITGKSPYYGTRTATFEIVARTNIAKAGVSGLSTMTYTGGSITPEPAVRFAGKTLVLGTDYTIAYKNNVNAGIATVTITGKNLYYGTRTATFKIAAAPIYKTSISAIPNQVYRAGAITPKPVVRFAGKTLALGADYTIAYKNNVNAGTATATITGKGNFAGSRSVTFKIAPAPISATTASGIANATWTGSAVSPLPVVKLGTKTLVEGIDYTVAYNNNVNAGAAIATIAGKGNFSGYKNVLYVISKANMADAVITALPQQTFTGQPLFPKPVIKLGTRTLVEGTDYTLSYSDNTAGGTARVTATGIGSMCGSKTATFEIAVPTIASVQILENAGTGAAVLDLTLDDFNKVFSYGDAIDIEFSNGYTIENIPYYSGCYAKLRAPLVLSHLDEASPEITTNYGERVWQMAELNSGMTATLRLAGKGTYGAVQDALSITYSDNRADFPTDAAFANFRQVVGGNLNGKLYRSASPISNWRKRAAYANALAESVGIAFVLDLSDTSVDIQSNIDWNRYDNVDTSYFISLFNAGAVELLGMNSSYSTREYQQKLCSGLAVMAHRDGPYLVHCVEGKDRTGFTCLVLGALAGSSYDEMLADYMETYANYFFITKESAPERYAVVQSICFDSMIDFLTNGSDGEDYAAAARGYLSSGGMSDEDIDLLVEKLTG